MTWPTTGGGPEPGCPSLSSSADQRLSRDVVGGKYEGRKFSRSKGFQRENNHDDNNNKNNKKEESLQYTTNLHPVQHAEEHDIPRQPLERRQRQVEPVRVPGVRQISCDVHSTGTTRKRSNHGAPPRGPHPQQQRRQDGAQRVSRSKHMPTQQGLCYF